MGGCSACPSWLVTPSSLSWWAETTWLGLHHLGSGAIWRENSTTRNGYGNGYACLIPQPRAAWDKQTLRGNLTVQNSIYRLPREMPCRHLLVFPHFHTAISSAHPSLHSDRRQGEKSLSPELSITQLWIRSLNKIKIQNKGYERSPLPSFLFFPHKVLSISSLLKIMRVYTEQITSPTLGIYELGTSFLNF